MASLRTEAGLTLTAEQRAAVEHPGGPARILAGAGTGKTRVIVARFHHLIRQGVKPERILVLTFSREAARQLRQEIVGQLQAAGRLWISTFHSFCLSVLAEEQTASPRLVQEPAARALLAELYNSHGPWAWYTEQRQGRFVGEAHSLIGHAKDQLLSPADVQAYAEQKGDARLADLAKAYRLFQERLRLDNAADFSDFIVRAVELLEANPTKWQGRFDQILVDEFQDTNLAQFRVLQLLSEKHRNLVVVGDDDQAIYRFRGATDRFMVDFHAHVAGAIDYAIEENFRCPAPVLELANRLIQHNEGRAAKRLYTTTKVEGYPAVRLWRAPSPHQEAEAVAEWIAQRVQAGEPPEHFAILCRSLRRSGEPFAQALGRRGIPYRRVGEGLTGPVLGQTLALLRLVYGQGSEADLLTVLSTQVEATQLFDWNRGDDPWASPAGEQLAAWLAEQRGLPFDQVVYEALKYLGHLQLSLTLTAQELERLNACRSLQQLAAAVADEPDPLAAFVEMATENGGGGGAGVTLMTVHAAKGLQFPVVFVVGLSKGRFPVAVEATPIYSLAEAIRRWLEGGEAEALSAAERQAQHLVEERRLCYVALTRAERELILSYPESEGPSRFLAEMGAPEAEEVGAAGVDKRSYLVEVATGRAPVLADRLEEAVRNRPDVPLRRQREPVVYGPGGSLHLSPSALEAYRTCPRKYYYKRVLGLPEEDSVHLAFGDGLHRALEKFNQARRAGETPPWEQLERWWGEALDPTRFDAAAQYAQFLERGRRFLRRYYPWVTSRAERVVAVEKRVDYPYVDGAGRQHVIHGVIDVVVEGADGRLEIVDYKSGVRTHTVNKRPTKGSEKNIERKLQLGIYHLAEFGETGQGRVSYHFLRHKDDQLPAEFVDEFDAKGEQVFSFEHSVETIEVIKADIDAAIEGILANDFRRTEDEGKCWGCPYKEPCEVSKDGWF